MIDESVILNEEKLPKDIQNVIKDLRYLQKIGDEDNYIFTIDVLEAKGKGAVEKRLITEDDYYKLMKKYGLEF